MQDSAVALIDKALENTSHRDSYSANEVADLLLDLRLELTATELVPAA